MANIDKEIATLEARQKKEEAELRRLKKIEDIEAEKEKIKAAKKETTKKLRALRAANKKDAERQADKLWERVRGAVEAAVTAEPGTPVSEVFGVTGATAVGDLAALLAGKPVEVAEDATSAASGDIPWDDPKALVEYVRVWGRTQGIAVSDRGFLPKAVREPFLDAFGVEIDKSGNVVAGDPPTAEEVAAAAGEAETPVEAEAESEVGSEETVEDADE